MSETSQQTVSAAEIEGLIGELEQYRERLANEVLQTAKKIKMPKKAAMDHVQANPEIAKIDAALKQLRSQQATMQ